MDHALCSLICPLNTICQTECKTYSQVSINFITTHVRSKFLAPSIFRHDQFEPVASSQATFLVESCSAEDTSNIDERNIKEIEDDDETEANQNYLSPPYAICGDQLDISMLEHGMEQQRPKSEQAARSLHKTISSESHERMEDRNARRPGIPILKKYTAKCAAESVVSSMNTRRAN